MMALMVCTKCVRVHCSDQDALNSLHWVMCEVKGSRFKMLYEQESKIEQRILHKKNRELHCESLLVCLRMHNITMRHISWDFCQSGDNPWNVWLPYSFLFFLVRGNSSKLWAKLFSLKTLQRLSWIYCLLHLKTRLVQTFVPKWIWWRKNVFATKEWSESELYFLRKRVNVLSLWGTVWCAHRRIECSV